MTGYDIFELANRLLFSSVGRSPEARFRSVVSRAYYGAFHVAREALVQLGCKPPPKNDDAHAYVCRKLNQTAAAEAVSAASLLNTAKTARNRADYQLGDPKYDKIDNARLAIERADAIIKSLTKCLAEPARNALAAHFAANP